MCIGGAGWYSHIVNGVNPTQLKAYAWALKQASGGSGISVAALPNGNDAGNLGNAIQPQRATVNAIAPPPPASHKLLFVALGLAVLGGGYLLLD